MGLHQTAIVIRNVTIVVEAMESHLVGDFLLEGDLEVIHGTTT